MAVRIDDRYHRDAEFPRFLNRDFLFVGIHHEERPGEFRHFLDAGKILFQMVPLALQPLNLFLGQQIVAAILAHLLEFFEARNGFLNRRVVGQQAPSQRWLT